MNTVKIIKGQINHNGKKYGVGMVVIKANIAVKCSNDELDNSDAVNPVSYKGHILTDEEKAL